MKALTSRRLFSAVGVPSLYLTVLIFAAWPGAPTSGQTIAPRKFPGGYQASTWGDRNGLPSTWIAAIASAPDGYLWFGTTEGIARFDGVRFVVFDSSNTPAFGGYNVITNLVPDGTGGFWVGSNGGRVWRWQGGKFTAVDFSQQLSSGVVTALWQDPAGDLWIGTEAGPSRWHDGQLTNYDVCGASPKCVVRAITGGLKGDVWLGSYNGVVRYRNGEFTSYGMREGLPGSPVRALLFDRQGTLWAGTETGLYTMSGDVFQPVNATEELGHIGSLLEGADGTIWAGSETRGLFHSSGPGGGVFVYQDGVGTKNIRSLFQSADGDLWIGTYDIGVTRLRRGGFDTIAENENLLDPKVRSLCEDGDGSVWVASEGGGLSRCWNDRATPLTPEEKPAGRVSGISADADGVPWVATKVSPNGQWLYRWTDGEFVAQSVTSDLPATAAIAGLLRNRFGGWIVGTWDHGVHLIGPDGVQTYSSEDTLGHENVLGLYQDRAGAIWIGTNGGGVSRLQDGQITTWTTRDGLGSNQVLSFYEDRSGTLWIGTHGGGLCRLKDGRFKKITRADGLYDDVAFVILEDDGGDLWMSGNKGIYRTSLSQLNDFADGRRKQVESFSYDAADGMISRECNGAVPAGIKRRDGRLWFPTVAGVVIVDPNRRNLTPPRVTIEQARVDQSVVAPGPLRINPHQEALEFQYTALSWSRPQHIRFRYQLEGLDRDWTQAGTRRTAFYTHLPPGAYRFRVQADNGDGVWSPEGASLAVTVLPPFWRTTTFKIALVIGAVLIAFGVARWRSRHLRERNRALEQLIEVRTGELRSAKEAAEGANHAKSAFLANMSHELRTPLNAILGFTQIMIKETKEPARAHDRERLTVVHQSGAQLLNMINEVLDLAKIEAGKITLEAEDCSLEALLEEVAAPFRLRAAEKGLEFREEHTAPLPAMVRTDIGKLRQVLLNLLNNALKFTERGAFVLQVASAGDDRVLFAVEDTGIGIRESEQAHIFEAFHQAADPKLAAQGAGLGLAISRRLVHLLGGNLIVESTPEMGSRFSFELDLPDQASTAPVLPRREEGTPIGYKGARRTVLVADDSAPNRGVLRGMLEPLGFVVEEVADGAECLARCGQAPLLDMLLLDLRMPKVDGLAVLRTLRSSTPPIPFKIVAISASVFPADARQALAAGCDDFLPKPFDESRLLEALRRLLDMEWVCAEPAESQDAATGHGTADEPAGEEINRLKQFAQIGDIVEFKRHLSELAATEPSRYGALAARLAPLIASYQIHRLHEELDRSLPDAALSP